MDSPMSIIKVLKGTSAKVLFEEHPSLRRTFRTGHLWGPRYYIGTVGHVSEATVAKYIREQKLRTVGRPPKGGRGRNSSPQ
jgi:putative transposase